MSNTRRAFIESLESRTLFNGSVIEMGWSINRCTLPTSLALGVPASGVVKFNLGDGEAPAPVKVAILAIPAVFESAPQVTLGTAVYDFRTPRGLTSTIAVHVPRDGFELGTYIIILAASAPQDSNGDGFRASFDDFGAPQITFSASKITLSETIAKSTLPASVAFGDRAGGSVTLSITNDGNFTTPGETTVSLFATTSGVVDDFSLKLATVTRPLRIKGGQSTQLTLRVRKLPFALLLLPSKYTVIANVTDQSTFVVVGTMTVN